MYTLLDVIRIYLKKYLQKEVKIGIFPTPIAYWSVFGISCNIGRINPDQIGMVGQSSLCEKKTKELNINVMYSLWILPK